MEDETKNEYLAVIFLFAGLFIMKGLVITLIILAI